MRGLEAYLILARSREEARHGERSLSDTEGFAAGVRGAGPGSLVLAYLHTPKERVWGALLRQDSSGIWLEGIDLSSFDDWARQIARGEESTIALSQVFYPMLRIEKIVVDRSHPGQPSMADRFRQIVGSPVRQHLGGATEGPGAD